MPFRILSLDAGGILGLVEVIVLQRLERAMRREGRTLLGAIDLIAGTSTGGLIGLGIARGLELDAIRALYEQRGPAIFRKKERYRERYPGSILPVTRDAPYGNAELIAAVVDVLGARTTLGDLERWVMVPALDLDPASGDDPKFRDLAPPGHGAGGWRPHVFTNVLPGVERERLAWKVAVAGSTVPAVFPIFEGFVDGGVFAPNPAMIALAQTRDARSLFPVPALGDVTLLSVGVGADPRAFPFPDGSDDPPTPPPPAPLPDDESARERYERGRREAREGDWGPYRWLQRDLALLTVLQAGLPSLATRQARQFLGPRLLRLDPPRPRDAGFHFGKADPATIERIVAFAGAAPLEDLDTGEDAVAWIREGFSVPLDDGVPDGGLPPFEDF